jgi:alkanesulfonate monooxygenase
MSAQTSGLKLFTTCPISTLEHPRTAVRKLEEVAHWSERAGCEGMLVFSDNRQLDPWLVAQVVIEATEQLSPLIAIQPAYMHPYTVAKMITSLAFLHDRRVCLNMVAGGFKNDLLALNDETPHDDRYARLVEYTTIVRDLLRGSDPMSFEGSYYTVRNLKLTPPIAPELLPGIFVSGSSPAGRDAAKRLGATAVEYPQPASKLNGDAPDNGSSQGIRIGLIVRDDESEAWSVAHERYPTDRKGQITRQLANKVSDSQWHRQLAELGNEAADNSPYWLVPFENYKAMCPYLVGSYDRVASELARYVDYGYTTFILDEPASAEELKHIEVAFSRASARCALA